MTVTNPVRLVSVWLGERIMKEKRASMDLNAAARAAAAGDKAAIVSILEAFQDDVYGLALRMLGHPADAEDAAQEILMVVLTHLGSFRGESSLRTWVWRIAAHHLSRVRRGRRETLSFETLDERLRTGLVGNETDALDPESEALARELRLRCTEAMILSLDRELRIAYLVGDVFGLSGEEAAEVLELEPAAFRKRLSRARSRLHDFMRAWCGVYNPDNPCRCAGQVDAMVARGFCT
jgi:RNA polymerase sigma factor (sigma-70 family)